MRIKSRVAISGSHGTGKSTLVESLGVTNRISEVARSIIESKGKNPITMGEQEKIEFEEEILSLQLKKEREYLAEYGGFLSDRSVIDVIAYSYFLISSPTHYERIKSEGEKMVDYDYVFYTPIEFPLERDGVRFEDEKFQIEVDEKIKELATEFGVELIPLTGGVEERKAKLLEIIGEFVEESE